MKIKTMVFPLIVIVFLSVILAQYIRAANDGTLSREATVPTTQSTVGMDEEESEDRSSSLIGPALDISREADRQRLLAGFAQEKETLKRMGLSEGEIKELKDAIVKGDADKVGNIYKKALGTTGGSDE